MRGSAFAVSLIILLVPLAGCSGGDGITDGDGDGIGDDDDNCPDVVNPDQINYDSDPLGNDCDLDGDNDEVPNSEDNCPYGELMWISTSSTDFDGDGCKDSTEDEDDDNDGVSDTEDQFPKNESETEDTDGDGIGDNEDEDDDNDGIDDSEDEFPKNANESQDSDGDGTGDNSDAFAIITKMRMDYCIDSSTSEEFLDYIICDDNRDINSPRVVIIGSEITLDGSDSYSGCNLQSDLDCQSGGYIVTWYWDLDIHHDTDGDGITDNDVDETGEIVNITMLDGEYEIKLTVINNHGAQGNQTTKLYVSGRNAWVNFELLNQDDISWSLNPNYDLDRENRIRYVRAKLSYPKTTVQGQENLLNMYVYNSTNVEIANTSSIGNENRDAGDCPEDDYCVWMIFGGATVRMFEPGTWTLNLVNPTSHNLTVNYLSIELDYR